MWETRTSISLFSNVPLFKQKPSKQTTQAKIFLD